MSEPDLTPQTPGDVPGTDTAKLEALAAGNVGDAADALDQLTGAELEQLAAIERAGKGRTTLLGFIERELASRDSGADNEPKSTATPIGDVRNYAEMRQADIDPSSIRSPVLSRDGWVLPAPSATPVA